MNGQDIREGQHYLVLPGARWANNDPQAYPPRPGNILVAASNGVDSDGDALLKDLETDPETYYYCLPEYLVPADAPQPKPGICPCRRDPNADGSSCEDCGHHASMHVTESGCVDGIDHPGSVGPGTATQSAHGPSAEQWARGVAMLVTAIAAKGTGASDNLRDAAQTMAEQYILTGDQ